MADLVAPSERIGGLAGDAAQLAQNLDALARQLAAQAAVPGPAAGPEEIGAPKILGVCAVVLASVNIFGGFIVTQRMLQMFQRKK